jgi:hypothetical protein
MEKVLLVILKAFIIMDTTSDDNKALGYAEITYLIKSF